ncbi:MAG: ankyrin repeat domain-containing protein [bacterium]
MNDLKKYEDFRNEILKRNVFSFESISEYQKRINTDISEEEADILGNKILEVITNKSYRKLDNTNTVCDIEKLILAGANLDVRRENGETAFIYSVKKGYYITFATLAMAGAKVNAQSSFLSTALMWASRYGYIEIVEDLILLGANLDMQCSDGDTALHSAAIHNQYDVIKLLIESGCIINLKNLKGKEPINEVMERNPVDGEHIINLIKSFLIKENQIPETIFTENYLQSELSQAKDRLDSIKKRVRK